MLVEAANAPPYVWMAAKHMESGHGISPLNLLPGEKGPHEVPQGGRNGGLKGH